MDPEESFPVAKNPQTERAAQLAVLELLKQQEGSDSSWLIKGPLKYLLMPLLGKNQLAITLHMYASIGPNLDNTHRGQI